MQNTKRLISILLILFCFQMAMAQNSINGNIRDAKTDQPLANVTIVLMRSDSTIIHYAYSEEDGRFDLKQSSEGVWIRLSIIGYKSIQQKYSEIPSDFIFRMNPEVFKLREVRVTTERIREDGDTLTYLVSGFKMIQDRSIGDVLKKMPGIEVNESGLIKFEGKPINRFYVEGLNLLDKRYQIGTKNIPVSAVKEVEILRNHQPIKALKDKSFSDQAALNLKLTDEAKSRWMFNFDLGIGLSPLLWKNRVMGMQFAKKRQMIALYKNDNTGYDIEGEIDEVMLADQSTATEDQTESPFSVAKLRNRQDAARNFTQTHLFSVNNLNQFDQNTSLRTQINYLYSMNDRMEQTDTRWFLPDSSSVFLNESSDARLRRNELHTAVSYESNKSAKFLKNAFRFGANWNDLKNEVFEQHNMYNEYYDLKKWQLGNEFSLINQIGKRTWEFQNNTQWSRLPQHLNIVRNNQGNESYDQQKVLLNDVSNDFKTSYGHTIGGFYVFYNLGWQLGISDITTDLSGSGYKDLIPQDSLQNDFRLLKSRLYVAPKINYEKKGLKFRLEAKVSWLGVQEVNRIGSESKKLLNFALFEPNLNISYALSSKWNVNGGFSRFSDGMNLFALLPNYFLKDYRTIQSNETSFGLNDNNIAKIGLEFSDPIRALFWRTSASMNWMKQASTVYDQFTGIILSSYQTDQPSKVRLLAAQSRLMKGFSWMNLRTYLTLGYNRQQQQRFLMDELTKMNRHTYRLSLEIYAQPFQWFNLEYRILAYWNELNQILPYKERVSGTFNSSHKIDLTFNIDKKWIFRSTNSIFKESQMQHPVVLSDLHLSYLFNKQEIGIILSNLFDSKKYYQNYISDFKEINRIVKIRPRQILFRYAFIFPA